MGKPTKTREEATHPRAVPMACPGSCTGGKGGAYARPGQDCPICGGRGQVMAVMADPPDAVPGWLERKERGEPFDEVVDRAVVVELPEAEEL